MKWIKVATDLPNDEKIQIIEAMPNGDTYIVIWFKLLCVAGKLNSNGAITINDKPINADSLSILLHRPVDVVKEAVNLFIDYGMVDWDRETGVIYISNWQKYQSMEEIAKEQNRQRQARYRARNKVINNAMDNVTVTPETCKAIVDYLNKKAGTEYDHKQQETILLINARITEGYSAKDFETVIDKKCAEWLETEFAQYLRPSTLFGKKFESYLKAPAAAPKRKNKRGSMYSAEGASFDISKYEKDSLFND